MPDTLLLINFAATWFMVGLIWLVQVVHYAQFDLIGEAGWTAYHRRHLRMISWIVAPPMLVELASSIALLFSRPAGMSGTIAWAGVGLVGAIWLSTAFLQVPMHDRLATAFDRDACRRLVATNWIRTIAWSIRGGVMAYAMYLVLAAR